MSDLAFTAASLATSTVTAHGTITWNASASLNAAAANAGGSASAEIGLLVKVYRATATTWTTGTVQKVVDQDLSTAVSYAGGASGGKDTATVSIALVAENPYKVTAELLYSAGAADTQGAPTGSAAAAAIDLRSKGHGAKLTSVTVA